MKKIIIVAIILLVIFIKYINHVIKKELNLKILILEIGNRHFYIFYLPYITYFFKKIIFCSERSLR